MKNLSKIVLILVLVALQNPIFAQTWQEMYDKADSLMQKRDFKNSIPLYEQALPLAEKEFGKESENYLKTRNGLGRSMDYVGMPSEKTEYFLLETIELAKKFGERTTVYAQALHNIGDFYLPSASGNKPQKSEQYLNKALSLRKEILGENHKDYSLTLAVLANLYDNMGNYSVAETLYKKTLQIQKNVFGENHIEYASSLNSLANLYYNITNYSAAKPLYIESLKIRKEILGEKSPAYANTLYNLAILYKTMGNYSIAEPLYQQALKIRKEVLGEKHPDYALSLNSLAILHWDMKNYSKSETYYKQALQIQKESLGEKHPDYITYLANLATLYMKMGNYANAKIILNKVLQVRKETVGEKHLEYAANLDYLGLLYEKIGNYATAEVLFKAALVIYKEELGLGVRQYPDYFNSLNNMAINYQIQEQNDLSLLYRVELQNNIKSIVNDNFSSLSEKEKTDFLNNNINPYNKYFNSFAITQTNLNAQLYDLQLFSKGILLNSVQKIKNRILNSKDSALIQEYESWNSLKISIAKYQQMSKEDFKKTGLNLDSLENLTNDMEKALSRKSESFAKISDKKTPTWKDIQKKLKKNEAAIEIVRVNKFGVQKIVTDTTDFQYKDSLKEFPKYPLYGLTDTVYYAALIIKKKSKQPELVLLTNGNELENQAFRKYRNKALYKLDDKESYQKYWLPIQEKLQKIKKVYFSPDGIYNQINLNILQNPKSQKYILDELEIQQITNTKEILAFQKALPVGEGLGGANFKASLFGRPAYDMDSVSYLANVEIGKETANNAYVLRDIRDLRKGSFSDLLGTEKEIQIIDSLLKTKNIKTEKHLLAQATEQKIKDLENPTILHIATHGFFIADSTTKNPMLNSGILLAGVSNYYRSENKPDTDDGILTASEAQNLHLDNTDLVVLSACETGLGEIRNGEGVYGLQRAFKAAGAKSILMSHWKVDDQVTQELMTKFYQNWLEIGDKRKAFKVTQAQIREKYKNPYFWGAFVLVGE